MAFLSYQNVANVSAVNFTSGIDNSNFYYQILCDSVVCPSSTTTSYIIVQFSDDGGSTYKTTNYINNLFPSITSGAVVGIVHDGSLSLAYAVDGQILFNNLWSGTGVASAAGNANSFCSSIGAVSSQLIGAVYSSSLVVNAFRIKSSDNNNITGNFYLYGG